MCSRGLATLTKVHSHRHSIGRVKNLENFRSGSLEINCTTGSNRKKKESASYANILRVLLHLVQLWSGTNMFRLSEVGALPPDEYTLPSMRY